MQDRQTYDDNKGKSTGDSGNIAQQQHTVGNLNRISKFSDEPPKQSATTGRPNEEENAGYRNNGKGQERFRPERSRSRDKNLELRNRDMARGERAIRKQSNFDRPPEEFVPRSRGAPAPSGAVHTNPATTANQIQYGGSRYRDQVNASRGTDNNPERVDREHHRRPSNTNGDSNENSADLDKERQRSGKEGRIPFDFKLLVKHEDRESFDSQFLDILVKQTGCYDVLFEEKYKIPEYPGSVLVIKSKLLQQKADALLMIVRKFELSEMQVFVPEALVSIVIGVKGRSINQLKRDTSCDIVVQQPVIGLSDRLITLKNPSPRILASAARQIYDLIECQASEDDLKQVVAKPLSKTELQTTAKFVISEKSMGYLIGKGGSFTKQLDDRKIYMHCGREQQNRALHSKEAVCSLKGSLADIETSIDLIVKRLASYYESSGKDYREVPLAVLIPFNMVTKIIGAGGCLIKELVLKTGAQIRVNSSKNDPKIEEIVVTIDGNLDQKRRGAQAILAQIELFKNGGPIQILENSQGWNSEMGAQMKNSIHFDQEQTQRKTGGDKHGEENEDFNKFQRKEGDRDQAMRRERTERHRNATGQNEQQHSDQDLNEEPEATWNNNSDCEEKGYPASQRIKEEPMMQVENYDAQLTNPNTSKTQRAAPLDQQQQQMGFAGDVEDDVMAAGEFTPTPDDSLNNVGAAYGKADACAVREASSNQQETKIIDPQQLHSSQPNSLRRNSRESIEDQPRSATHRNRQHNNPSNAQAPNVSASAAEPQDDFMQEFEHSHDEDQQYRASSANAPQQSAALDQQVRRSSQNWQKGTNLESEIEVYIRQPQGRISNVPQGIQEKERNCFVLRGDTSQICNKFRNLMHEMEQNSKGSAQQSSSNYQGGGAHHHGQRTYQSKNNYQNNNNSSNNNTEKTYKRN